MARSKIAATLARKVVGGGSGADVNALAGIFDRELEEPSGPEIDALLEHHFGPKQECPRCGSLVVPGLICWGCEEWRALA